ncbi:succinate dehydrogenase assembly factor 4, mitochondrial-like [Selaginella moellendorffii]|uniref:succinate dehydrogenase assembly factor 4, mitochondrial-like n=1 Tax=Selaginella moellendorffii TaxID=88036 RepID=UPI000D1CF227|nr:succinate dehydrogenase assembly factor 4, mitochondrial-like [Selaginella moellendorffii]|eukprot:XP_024528924.1 succinate dehydrogenase assembly factor 4, mitochondrial-like [Selaginella moellendorffii]
MAMALRRRWVGLAINQSRLWSSGAARIEQPAPKNQKNARDSKEDPKEEPSSTRAESNKNENENGKGVEREEVGGPQGLEPTRYGDWEKAGRCYDF